MTNNVIADAQIKLVELLEEATRRKMFRWKPLSGDCYASANLPGRTYDIEWLYWYDSTGITIGRIGLKVGYGGGCAPSYWGTRLFECCQLLLEAIDGEWLEYHRRLETACVAMVEPPLKYDPAPVPSATNMLQALLRATVFGRLNWTKLGEAHWEATEAQRTFSIRLQRPVDHLEIPLAEVLAEIAVPGANLAFVAGTQGFELINKILCCADPARKADMKRTAESLGEAITSLEQLIDDAPPQ